MNENKIKVIPLNNGMFASVDERDYEAIMALGEWRYEEETGTAYSIIDGKKIYMHNLIISMHSDEFTHLVNENEDKDFLDKKNTINIDGFDREIDAALAYDAVGRFLNKEEEELNFPVELPIPQWIIYKIYETLIENGIEISDKDLEFQLLLSKNPNGEDEPDYKRDSD